MEERDDGTTANLYEMQETAVGMDMVAGYDGAVVPGVRQDGCVILLQHSAGEHRDCVREEAVNVPTPEPTPEPVLDVGEPPPEPEAVPGPTMAETPTPLEEPLGGTLTVAGDRAALVALVHEFFPDDSHMGNVVVWGETLTRNDWWDYVYGGAWSRTMDCGLMQTNIIHAGKYARHGWDISMDCFDPVKNLTISREIYDTQGPGAWTSY